MAFQVRGDAARKPCSLPALLAALRPPCDSDARSHAGRSAPAAAAATRRRCRRTPQSYAAAVHASSYSLACTCRQQENQFRANIEFLRSTSGRSRIIKLNHRPDVVPPQLAFRLHPAFWAAFMADVGQLSLHHPYSQSPKAKDMCTWAACFGLGAVVGLFCISPDAGERAEPS